MTASFFIALVIGILAGLGVGSGGLYLVYLRLFTDTPQREAQALNLAFFIFALLSAVIYHMIRRTYRDPRVLVSMLTGIPGAAVGSFAAGYIPQEWLRRILGVIFIVAAVYTLFSHRNGDIFKSFIRKSAKKLDKARRSSYND